MKSNKTAVVFGASGQDGSYLCELLADKNYDVIAVHRRNHIGSLSSSPLIKPVIGDILDKDFVQKTIAEAKPDEVYNLAAQSNVRLSFDIPEVTYQTNFVGAANIMSAVRDFCPHARFYQASTSEMFGNKVNTDYRQDEDTEFDPQSPYAIAKLAAHHATRMMRQAYGLFACSGILFNHESPRRPSEFVSRKIARWAVSARRAISKREPVPRLKLGNLDACRDWGCAPDYVRGMWQMLQQEEPGDYVLATGETHTVREFVQTAGDLLGFNPLPYLDTDPTLFRPAEVYYLRGDASKARRTFGWHTSMPFEGLVSWLLASELRSGSS